MESTEQEIYDSAVEQTQNAPEATAEAPQAAETGTPRDEKGRFAPKAQEATSQVAEEPSSQVQAETQPESDAKVPSWRLAEEAQRRREAEQALNEVRNEIRQMQMAMAQRQQPPAPPPPEPVDIFADPNGFVQQLQGTFEQRLAQVQLENSLRFARYAHGERFDQAYQEFVDHAQRTRDQATYQRVMASSDPGEALVQWYQEQQLQRELGGSDLKTFLEKQREEWLKDPSVQAKVIEAFKATQQASPPTNINLPPSLSKATSAAPAHDVGGNTGADIYSYATAKR